MYTSLLQLYKTLMFPKNENTKRWTMSELDQMDVHFFYEVLEADYPETVGQPQDKEVYINDIW